MLQCLDDMLWKRRHLGLEELAERRIRVAVAVAEVKVAGHQILPIQLLNKPSGSYSARTLSRRAMASSVANRAGRWPRFSSAKLNPLGQVGHCGHVGPRPVGVLRFVGGVLPGAVERQVNVGLDAVSHVLAG